MILHEAPNSVSASLEGKIHLSLTTGNPPGSCESLFETSFLYPHRLPHLTPKVSNQMLLTIMGQQLFLPMNSIPIL